MSSSASSTRMWVYRLMLCYADCEDGAGDWWVCLTFGGYTTEFHWRTVERKRQRCVHLTQNRQFTHARNNVIIMWQKMFHSSSPSIVARWAQFIPEAAKCCEDITVASASVGWRDKGLWHVNLWKHGILMYSSPVLSSQEADKTLREKMNRRKIWFWRWF